MIFNPDTLLSRTFSDSSLQTLFPHLLFLFPEFILHDGCNFSAIFVICQELVLKFCYNFENRKIFGLLFCFDCSTFFLAIFPQIR